MVRAFLIRTRPIWLALLIGLTIVGLVAAGVYAAVEIRKQQSEVERITNIIEGTPGPQGEPGLGVERVSITILPTDANPTADLQSQHLRLGIPRGATGAIGPQGPQGPRGSDGPRGATGNRGAQGKQGPQVQRGNRGGRGAPGQGISDARIAAAVNVFFRTHVFNCTRINRNRFVCRAGGRR